MDMQRGDIAYGALIAGPALCRIYDTKIPARVVMS
jgi:hypothetical protein